MDLRPVEAIGEVRLVGVKRSETNVAPPFAIDGAGRMEQDSYNAGAKQQKRGLEDEELEASEEEAEEQDSSEEEPHRNVNLFA